MKFPIRRIGVAAVVVVLALVAGGIAYATIPGSGGTIHTCYKKSSGALRVIDDSVTNCKSNETALSWNQTGPSGADGAPGLPGPTEGVAAESSATAPATLSNQFNYASDTESHFTTTISGKLQLTKPFSAYMTCGLGFVWWWIALDGSPVQSSLAETEGTDFNAYTLVGVTASAISQARTACRSKGCARQDSANEGVVNYSAGTALVLGG